MPRFPLIPRTGRVRALQYRVRERTRVESYLGVRPEGTPALILPNDAAARAHAWLMNACFPFWAAHGLDPRGGFRERLSLDGAPMGRGVTRVRVQARQTFVFAQAYAMGWRPARAAELTARGVDAMLGFCMREDGLFGRIAEAGRGLVDDAPELYDNAFCIMALAAAHQVLQADEIMDAAAQALAALDKSHAHPAGGYSETLPAPPLRRQNPHMHCYEAMLACWRATKDPDYLRRADALSDLLVRRFLHPRSGRLMELFTQDWAPVDSAEGQRIEPGHEFEWVWLAAAHAAAAGRPPPAHVTAMYRNACSALDARGLAPQTLTTTGARLDASRRTWPQTEVLKAHLCMAAAGEPGAREAAAQTFESLFADYLEPAPPGGWIDHYDADGRPCAADMPASTGYHIVLGLSEVVRSAREPALA